MDRESVISELVEHIESALSVDSDYVDCVRTDLLQYTVALLKEQEEHKTGKWEVQPSNKEQGERDFIWWKCSECGQVIYSESERDRKEFHKYCSRCGSLMT